MTTSETAIRALEQAWADAERAADADALDQLAAPEFSLVGPLGFVLTREQWSQRYRSGELRTTALVWEVESVAAYGDAAVTVGTHTQTASYQGQPADGSFRSTHVAVRRGGRWQLAAIHLSAIQAPARPDEAGSAGGQ